MRWAEWRWSLSNCSETPIRGSPWRAGRSCLTCGLSRPSTTGARFVSWSGCRSVLQYGGSEDAASLHNRTSIRLVACRLENRRPRASGSPARDDLFERLTRQLIETLLGDGGDRCKLRVDLWRDPDYEASGVRTFRFDPFLCAHRFIVADRCVELALEISAGLPFEGDHCARIGHAAVKPADALIVFDRGDIPSALHDHLSLSCGDSSLALSTSSPRHAVIPLASHRHALCWDTI